VVYRKLSDAWRHEVRPESLGGLGALGGVGVQIPNIVESKAEHFGAVDSLNTEVSGERDRFNSINQGELNSRIWPWGAPKPSKAPKVDNQHEDAVWSDAEEERAAIAEYDGGAPRPWAEALARLDPGKVPLTLSQQRWVQFIDDCGRFLDQGWATHADGLGWGPLDLFGCDRERPPADDDHAGLLWHVEGGKLVIMSAYSAIIETATGQQRVFQRRNNRPGELALAWELTSGESKVGRQ
jgi:hypothetical protein